MLKSKTILSILVLALSLIIPKSIATAADFTITVPTKPTNIWTETLTREWKTVLNKTFAIKYHPGARHIPGVNMWHNDLQDKDDSLLFTHGGNAMAHLLEPVEYDLRQYAPIGAQNLAIIVMKRTDVDYDAVAEGKGKLITSYNPGVEPDLMALTLLFCGDDKSFDEYLKCYKDRFVLVRAMKGSERTLAFARGELNMLRGNPTNYAKNWINLDNTALWFSHGVFDMDTGKIKADPNGYTTFNDVFKEKHGKLPSGRFYNAYALIKNYRDLLQKIIWTGQGNPNIEELRSTLSVTLEKGSETRTNIESRMGKYDWLVGDELKIAFAKLQEQTDEQTLKDVIWWYENAYNFKTEFKADMVAK